MVKVLVPVADGSEEMETVIIVDVLRRAGAEVTLASVMPDRMGITASRRVHLKADLLIEQCVSVPWDMIVLPGGMPGAEHLHRCSQLAKLLLAQQRQGKYLAAICAAPAVALGPLGLLRTARATCHPNFRELLGQYAQEVSDEAVVVDGKLVTSQGPGTAMAFSLQLAECLFGEAAGLELRRALVV